MTEPRIKTLSEDLISKIAAGEVVERPASVVKELIENSIDAHATRITIEVQNAGRKLIRVSDNGDGMNRDEVLLAVQRHTTSKISKLDDLFNIRTLGFRGEALPSISSVSKLEVRSRVKGEGAGIDAGSQLKVEGGKIIHVEDAGCPVGTTVIVKDLFYNTPARRKFLKSNATEMGHIGNIVSKYVMAFPQIAFELISDGKPLLSSPGSGNLKDAVIAVYGVELAKELIENEFHFQLGKIYGLVSPPTLSRIDKTYETFYVNRRYVRNFLLNRALEEAYRTLIPNNRYPVAILFIELDPKQVDVNVHPTKREVKFLKTQEVMDAITTSIKNSLSKFGEHQKISSDSVIYYDDSGSRQRREVSEKEWKPEMADVLFPVTSHESRVASQEVPIYQYKDTYIICTDGEDLVLIDQHAAHERILYEQLRKQETENRKQGLLIPENIEVNPKEAIILQENMEYLKSLGFDLEEFGNNSYLLRSVPAVATKASPKQLVMDIISEVQDLGKSAQLEIKQENIRKLIACHSAIKAGDKLTSHEMNQLIKDLYATANPTTCPHGRPTMVRLTEEELKKRFGR